MQKTPKKLLLMLRLMRWWPPFLGMGIRVSKISPDLDFLEVELKARFWNKNYVGTAFGGALMAMTDPFFMLMLMQKIGSKYFVWDKATNIRFKKPGRGKLTARFEMPNNVVDNIRRQADDLDKIEPIFNVDIKDKEGNVVATVEKLLSIKRKDKVRSYREKS